MTARPFSLSSAAVGSSASITEGAPDQRARHGDALLLAAAQVGGIGLELVAQADLLQRALRAHDRLRAALAAHVEREAHVLLGRQRREQVVGLEDEADVPAAQLGQLLRRQARRSTGRRS